MGQGKLQEQPFLRSSLIEQFRRFKQRNPRYSLRAFSKRLGVGHSAISEIMSGKRRISKKKALLFCDRLELRPDEKRRLLQDFDKTQDHFDQLELAKFDLIANPIHFDILSLLEMDHEDQSIEAIAARTGNSKQEVQQALDNLVAVGLIQKPNGQWIPQKKLISTGHSDYSRAIRENHKLSLMKAHDAVESVPTDKRFLLNATMAVDMGKLEEANMILQDAAQRLSQLFESCPKQKKTEVYKCQLAWFPVSIKKGENK